MSIIDRLRTPAAMIGLFLGGLLLFAVVGIAREMGSATVAGSVQNSVWAAVERPVQPTAVQGTWMKTQVAAGARWVFADNWYSCAYVRGGDYAVGAGYDVVGWPTSEQWRALPLAVRQEIERICHE